MIITNGLGCCNECESKGMGDAQLDAIAYIASQQIAAQQAAALQKQVQLVYNQGQTNMTVLTQMAIDPNTVKASIAQAYQTYLGRPAGDAEITGWASWVTSGGMTLDQVISSISGSAEAIAYKSKAPVITPVVNVASPSNQANQVASDGGIVSTTEGWFMDSSSELISGVPNWILGAGVLGLGFFLFGRKE